MRRITKNLAERSQREGSCLRSVFRAGALLRSRSAPPLERSGATFSFDWRVELPNWKVGWFEIVASEFEFQRSRVRSAPERSKLLLCSARSMMLKNGSKRALLAHFCLQIRKQAPAPSSRSWLLKKGLFQAPAPGSGSGSPSLPKN